MSHPVWAQSEYNYSLENNHSIILYGKASLHNWSVSVGRAEGIGAVIRNNDNSFDLNQLELMMDVYSISSSGGPVMDNNTYKMLKAKKYPKITFNLISPLKSIPSDGKGHMIMASGILTVAGIAKQIIIPVTVKIVAKDEIIFEGSKLMKMSDFEIETPSTLFGVLKVDDEVSIQFKANFTIENNL